MTYSPGPSSESPLNSDPITSVLRKTYDTNFAPPPPSQSYPSIRSISSTPSDRLARAHPSLHHHPLYRSTVLDPSSSKNERKDDEDEDDDDDDNDGETQTTVTATDPDAGEATILYLAYGSNLCAKTFLGVRRIRPVSQVNVTAPSLTLTFDLPGLPYREPCFANTAPRVFQKKQKKKNKKNKNGEEGSSSSGVARGEGGGGKLPGGGHLPGGGGIPGDLPSPPSPPGVPKLPPALIGVVYEVTRSDFARIVATEGGGSSYRQIIVPCLPLPPTVSIPEKPDVPDTPPRPFLARTLCQPRIPDIPSSSSLSSSSSFPSFPSSFLTPHQRPNPSYAQPSHRYLSLLRTGALEHDLPPSYQARLNSLPAYSLTRPRQRLGRLVLSLLWAPWFLLLFGLAKLLGDRDTGRSPAWLLVAVTVLFNAVWTSYDAFFKPVFGDGERTEVSDGEGEGQGQGEEGEEEEDGYGYGYGYDGYGYGHDGYGYGHDGDRQGGSGEGQDCGTTPYGTQEDPETTPPSRKKRRSSVVGALRKLGGATKIVDEEKRALLSVESDSD